MAGAFDSFDPAVLEGLPEPVRKYFQRNLAPGVALPPAWRIRMKGSIRVGMKLPFEAEQELGVAGFRWKARVPSRRFRLLEVTDYFRDGKGGMVGRMFGRQVFADQGPDAARSAATRAVMESTMAPATLLPGTGAEWTFSSPTELRFQRSAIEAAEEVTLRTDETGRVQEVEAMRWRKDKGKPGGLLPFRCRFEGELDFNGMKVPSRMIAGWVNQEFEPFFEARITSVEGMSIT